MKKYGKWNALMDNATLLAKTYGPEAKMGFGLGLIAAGFVLAIKTTRENVDEIEEAEDELIEIHEKHDDMSFYESSAEYRTSLSQAYRKLAVAYFKAYSLPAICLIFGTVCVIRAVKDVRTQQMESAAAAGILTKELNDLYSRLEEKYGKEEADKLRYGFDEKELDFTEKDEDGNEQIVKKKVNIVSPDWNGFYTYRWDKTSSTWRANKFMREAMKQSIEDYGNNLLAIRAQTNPRNKGIGWLWLNEMLTAFDIPNEDEGQDCGWIYEPCNQIGDNGVDIEMIDAYETNAETGKPELVTFLRFNVDGAIRPRIFR